MSEHTCPSCGSSGLVKGALQSTGAIRFRPMNARFLTFRTADIAVQAAMCPGCGAIALHGDVEKMEHLRSAPSRSGSVSNTGVDV